MDVLQQMHHDDQHDGASSAVPPSRVADERSKKLQTLLIDNYDSYTFNLFQYLAHVNGCPPHVIKNDEMQWSELKTKLPHYDNIVISPGPGLPYREQDFGVCAKLLEEPPNIPILGVCLGHQGIGHLFGAKVIQAPKVAHGVVSGVTHNGSALFHAIPSEFKVVRYHSWIVDSVPEILETIAWTTEDRLVMGIKHKEYPMWGVQFHPESICTEFGLQLVQNFHDITCQMLFNTKFLQPGEPVGNGSVPWKKQFPSREIRRDSQPFETRWTKLDNSTLSSESLFLSLYSQKDNAFWLDSSRTDQSRFSFMGSCDGPYSFVIMYDVVQRVLNRTSISGHETIKLSEGETLFHYMQSELNKQKCSNTGLPFDFNGGFIGYFGYEMKLECGAYADEYSKDQGVPDAAFFFVDRFIAVDHKESCIYLVSLVDKSNVKSSELAMEWLNTTSNQLKQMETNNNCVNIPLHSKIHEPLKFILERSYECYKADIRECLKQIQEGESYELCLTNKIFTSARPDPVAYYCMLRKANPAPYAAFLRFNKDLHILSSSPEKFMSIDRNGIVECKPIKGTVARGNTKEEDNMLKNQLQGCPKSFAENLMIVDLIRNDISKFCDIGTVNVPKLMHIESYATVHQLVTTVRGKVKEEIGVTDCIRHSFPPGSMTGAPKLRSMQILNRLEQSPRGVYSGILGFIGMNESCNMSVVIRTAVITQEGTSIGCGGAIVADSDEEEEFQEMMLKAKRLLATMLEMQEANSNEMFIDGIPAELSTATVITVNSDGEALTLTQHIIRTRLRGRRLTVEDVVGDCGEWRRGGITSAQ